MISPGGHAQPGGFTLTTARHAPLALAALALVALAVPPTTATEATDVPCTLVAADVDCEVWESTPPNDGWTYSRAATWSHDGALALTALRNSNTVVVEAHDGQTGAPVWKTTLGGAPASLGATLAAAPGAVYVADKLSAWRLHGETGAIEWSAQGVDGAISLAVAPDGSTIYLAGDTDGAPCSRDVAVAAIDATTGASLWRATRGGAGCGPDAGRDLALSPDGSRLYVAADVWGHGSYEDHAVYAFDAASGALAWERVVGTPLNDRETNARIAVSPDGTRVVVAGTTLDQLAPSWSSEYRDYHVAVLDASDGTVVAIDRFDAGSGTLSDRVTDVVAVGDRFVVTGTIRAPSALCCIGLSDAVTLAYDARAGTRLWQHQFATIGSPGNAGNADDDARWIAATPDGASVVVGLDHRGEWSLLAYDVATGAPKWRVVHDVPGFWDTLDTGAVSPDGVALLAGHFNSERNRLHVAAYATDWAVGAVAPRIPGGI